jgi:hypothetical protein
MRRSENPPVLDGLVEVENEKVVDDLALLYNKIAFELLSYKTYLVFLKDNAGKRDYTRGILKFSGNLHRELLNVLANNWTS